MGPEIRTAAPAHATGAVIFVPIEEIAEDDRFRLRPEGEASVLAASIGRLGQLEPVELRPLPGTGDGGPRWQLVAGFRRLAALRLLMRERVLARVHEALGDEDAWALALVQGLTGEPLAEAELLALRDRLVAAGVAPWAAELVEEARLRAPLPAEVRERFYEFLNPNLASGAPSPWPSPPPGRGRGKGGWRSAALCSLPLGDGGSTSATFCSLSPAGGEGRGEGASPSSALSCPSPSGPESSGGGASGFRNS